MMVSHGRAALVVLSPGRSLAVRAAPIVGVMAVLDPGPFSGTIPLEYMVMIQARRIASKSKIRSLCLQNRVAHKKQK